MSPLEMALQHMFARQFAELRAAWHQRRPWQPGTVQLYVMAVHHNLVNPATQAYHSMRMKLNGRTISGSVAVSRNGRGFSVGSSAANRGRGKAENGRQKRTHAAAWREGQCAVHPGRRKAAQSGPGGDNARVAEFIRRRAFELIDDLNKTSVKKIQKSVQMYREQLAKGVEQGEANHELEKRLRNFFTNPARAKTVAQTEVHRAVHGSSLLAAKDSGAVTGKTWLAHPGACPECEALNGVTVGLDEEFAEGVQHPGLHPNCFCDMTFEIGDVEPEEEEPKHIAERIADFQEGNSLVDVASRMHAEAETLTQQHQQIVADLSAEYVEYSKKPTPEGHAKYSRKWHEHNALSSRLTDAQQKQRARMFELMAGKPGPRHEVKVKSKSYTNPAVEEGRAWVNRMLRKKPGDEELAPIKIVKTTGDDAHFDSDPGNRNPKVALAEHDDVSTAIHEMFHHVECENDGVFEAGKEFLKHRLKGEKKKKLAKLFPGAGYEDDEYGAKDQFDKALPESVAYYTAKTYYDSDPPSSEVITVGVEYMHRDPVKFFAKDPEFAKFIFGILTGHLR